MKDFFLRHLHQHTIDDAMQLWDILQDRDFRTLFLRPTENTIIQLIRYGITGGTSFLVDYLLLYSLERAGAHYLIAAALAFLMGISCNFLLTKHFAFRAVDAAVRKKMILCAVLESDFGYDWYGKINHLLPKYDARVLESDFGATVRLRILLDAQKVPAFCRDLTELTAAAVQARVVEEVCADLS